MAKTPKVIKVTTVAEFTKAVESLLPTTSLKGNWYRGVGQAQTYTLRPGLFRHPVITDLAELIRLEAQMLEDFERFSILHNAALDVSGEHADLKKLFFMQHYAIPTRLLDWSTNPFIALYFALSTARQALPGTTVEDSAVWVLDPTEWNKTAMEHQSYGDAGPMVHSHAMNGYGPRRLYSGEFEATALKTLNESAACILGITNSIRMFAQRGVFTIFGRDTRPMEEQFGAGKYNNRTLTKLIIPSDKTDSMLSAVLRMGYTDSVSYPDLQGLAMEIKRSRGFRL